MSPYSPAASQRVPFSPLGRRFGGAREMKKQNVDRARELRRDSTEAETALWRRLRGRGVDGAKFVRQEPIGPYIADFVCRNKKLIIEIDGGQHAEKVERDEARTKHLESF